MPLDGQPFRGSDPRPSKRVKNKDAMKSIHAKGCFCVLNCGNKGESHHIIFKSQGGDDNESNLCCICPDHHRLIHAENQPTLVLLGEHLLFERPDVIAYVKKKLGPSGGDEWLRKRLHISG